MNSRNETFCLTDEGELERRIKETRPLAPSERAGMLADIRAATEREADLAAAATGVDVDVRRAHFEKWRLIHHFVRRDPYRDRVSAKRTDQWRDALARLRAIGENDFIDWLVLQAEVAQNLEQGIQDMRPRKGGPTWLVALEYVANRKRKATALLRWAEGAVEEGCYSSSDPHIRVERDPRFAPGAGGHEEPPFIVDREG